MNADILQPPQNPVELASVRAEQLSGYDDSFDATIAEKHALTELDHAAETLGFINSTYYLSATRGFIFPKTILCDKPVTYTSVLDVSLEGQFATYSRISIGRLIGRGSVRAICMTFDDAILLSTFNRLEKDFMLYVPVLGVDTILAT